MSVPVSAETPIRLDEDELRSVANLMVLRGIRKVFGETTALAGLDLDIHPGEVLGIAGPNGAGKSTLVRVLAGEEMRDAGEIEVDGRPWDPGNPADPVAVVHQEPQLWTNLSLGQNLLVGRESARFAFPRLRSSDLAVLEDIEIAGLVDRRLEDCSLAVRQRVEIARALARDARFFLFDEPNSALTEDESQRLFAYVHELARRGRIVILVTHRLAEMAAHCDRVAVIRDGLVTAVLGGDDLSEARIARELVVGAAAGEARRRAGGAVDGAAPDVALELRNWSHPEGAFRDVELLVRRGEVLALVGVEGSGARELVASAAGYEPASGTIRIGGGGAERFDASTAYLSADRRGTLFQNLSVGENLVIRLGAPEIAAPNGFLWLGRLRRLGAELVRRFGVRTRSPEQPLASLSGGNQQKVAIAAAIARRPAVLVLEEPTRGVDIGSKGDIYRILREYAADGHAVLAYCTEVPEVYELADRVSIVDDGRPSEALTLSRFPDVTSLAATIATREHTEVGAADLAGAHTTIDTDVESHGTRR